MNGIEPSNLGGNIITTRERNLSIVIKLIYKFGICSRSEIAKATGLKHATITNIINSLIEWGLVQETGIIESSLKRRSIGIELNKDRYRLIGVRLSRDSISVGVCDLGNALLHQKSEAITNSPERTIDRMVSLLKETITSLSDRKIIGIGIALPGPFVAKKGRIALMSGFSGWEAINVKKHLQASLDVPIFLEHDANCAILAEWRYGEAGDDGNIMLMLLDDGVGSSIIANGKLYHGHIGTAGEIGHSTVDFNGLKCQCGNRGCLELYCSTLALRRLYNEQTSENISAVEIIQAVHNGDANAVKVFEQVAQYLAYGLVNAINTLNPKMIILSGTLTKAGGYLLEILKPTLKERLIKDIYENLDIRLGRFGDDTLLYGASALVLEEALRAPSHYFNPFD